MSHRIIQIILFFSLLLLVNGCTFVTFHKVKTPKPVKSEIIVSVPKDKENKTIWVRNDSFSSKDKEINTINKKIAETFYVAAIYGKQKGYDYFALTNDNLNNLNGFPINTLDNLIELYKFEEEDAKKYYKPRQLISSRHGSILSSSFLRLQLQYFKKPIPGLFFYNIDEVIQQTDKYMSN